MSCSVPGCSNARRFKPEGIIFHTFPRDSERLKLWLNVLNKKIDGWTWSKNKIICSVHFGTNDFFMKGDNKLLKKDTVPIIAGCPTAKGEDVSRRDISAQEIIMYRLMISALQFLFILVQRSEISIASVKFRVFLKVSSESSKCLKVVWIFIDVDGISNQPSASAIPSTVANNLELSKSIL
ncbi:hypothetical protein FQR65_LT10912 [Abscondita terminalis]|nr:hypothetical protein FQR65_LT10912 [Abscondita terminalis]